MRGESGIFTVARKSQIQEFRETARKLECDEDERKFDDALRKVASAPPPPKDSKPQPKKPGK